MASVSEEQWREKVRRELKGKPWDSAFVNKTSDDITIKPLYTVADRPTACAPIVHQKSGWNRVFEIQSEHTNGDLLSVLELGINTLWVRFSKSYPNGMYKGCSNRELVHWKKLFFGVQIHLLKVCVVLGDHPKKERDIFNRLGSESGSVLFFEDCISDEMMGSSVNWDSDGFLSSTRFAQLTGASPINELVLHLRLWANLRRHTTLSPEQIAGALEIELPSDANIFETVAKHRALHKLWNGFWSCLNVSSAPSIVSVTSPRMMSDLDEHINILRSTHASTAAILGGCSSLNILPFDYRLESSSQEAVRISALLHGLLAEEAQIGAIQDPFAGSYYVESLTEQMAEAAWEAFRVWSRDEHAPVVDDGILKKINQTRQRRVASISHRYRPLTAVSEFPELGVEHLPRKTRWTSNATEIHFDSDVFTDIRRVVESQVDRHPVHIICIGREAEWTGRYHFTLNAFAVGGWAHTHSSVPNLEELQKLLATLKSDETVCLCAADSVYDNLDGQVLIDIQHRYLAGPKKYALSVDATPVFKGCNLQKVLADLTDLRCF